MVVDFAIVIVFGIVFGIVFVVAGYWNFGLNKTDLDQRKKHRFLMAFSF